MVFVRQLPIQEFTSLELVADNRAYRITFDYHQWQTSFAEIRYALSRIKLI
jgi:putative protein-disulfide isomerase